jgi:hypothetical protein
MKSPASLHLVIQSSRVPARPGTVSDITMSTVNMPAKILFNRASIGSGHLYDSGPELEKHKDNRTFVRAKVVFCFTHHHASDLRMVL